MYTRKVTSGILNGKLAETVYDHYVAVDWSQRTMAVAHLGRRGSEPSVFERPADVRQVKQYLRSLRGSIVLTIEETTTAQWLYLELRDDVARIIVCNPYRNRLLTAGPKTDKIDAVKLCLLLRSGLLTEVFHSNDQLYDLRRLVSAYTDVIQAGVRALNQRSAIERGHAGAGAQGAFMLEHVDKSIALYRETKAEYAEKFDALCRSNPDLQRLRAVEGIGTKGAVKILASVVDARRFPSKGHYLSYCGLVRLEKLSGGRRYGSRRPQYNRMLKSVYKIAALAALKTDNPIREYYDALLTRGMASHHARHQVARHIAIVTYGILKTKTPYDPSRWRTTTDSTLTH